MEFGVNTFESVCIGRSRSSLMQPCLWVHPSLHNQISSLPRVQFQVPNPLYAFNLASTDFTAILPFAILGAKTLGVRYLIVTVGKDTIEIYYKLHTTNTTASVEATPTVIISTHHLLCDS